jgi:phage protein D
VLELIDQPMTPANILRLYAATAVALTRWEDRLRLVSLAISEKRGDEADQLDIVLDDADGLLAIPPEGARLLVMLGWKQGRDVAPGLVHKGSFKVDEVNHSGPPDQIRIRARAADFTSAIRNRRE